MKAILITAVTLAAAIPLSKAQAWFHGYSGGAYTHSGTAGGWAHSTTVGPQGVSHSSDLWRLESQHPGWCWRCCA